MSLFPQVKYFSVPSQDNTSYRAMAVWNDAKRQSQMNTR